MDIVEVGAAHSARKLGRLVQRALDDEGEQAWQNAWPRYAWAAASSVAITLATTPLHGYLDLANIVMLFLLGVVGVAMRWGRGPAALAAVLNVAAFDFFLCRRTCRLR